jgi:hypothetical protein
VGCASRRTLHLTEQSVARNLRTTASPKLLRATTIGAAEDHCKDSRDGMVLPEHCPRSDRTGARGSRTAGTTYRARCNVELVRPG